MRKNKFRAWHKEKKCWMSLHNNGYSFNPNNGQIYYEGLNISSRIELMQYTGLKDKNGKEIYEGDIVKISDHPFQGSIDINGNYEVNYNEYMELSCGGWYLHRMRHWAVVIGNISENPELLKN